MTESLAPYVEYHGNAYVRNAIDSHATGLKVQFRLRFEDGLDTFKAMTKKKKGKAGQIFHVHYRPVEETEYRVAEVWLLGVTWSHTHGTTVAFGFNDKDEWQSFRDWPAIAQGKEIEPQEVEFLLYRVGADGKLVNIEQRDKIEAIESTAKARKGGPLSKRAAQLCNDDAFLDYIRETDPRFDYVPNGARNYIYLICSVDSRAELDHVAPAAEAFKKMLSTFIRNTSGL